MRILVNGEPTETQAGSLAELLREQDVDPARVAVVQNDCIVPAPKRASAWLAEGDRVELLTFAGGG